MNQKIGVTDGRVIMLGVSSIGPGMMKINAHAPQKRADFPNIGADDEVRTHGAAGYRRQNARNAAVFETFAFALDGTPDAAHGATGADRGRKPAVREGNRLLRWIFSRDSGERKLQAGERGRQVLPAKALKRLAMQELGPECLARQRSDFAPLHAGGQHCADQAACAGSGYERRLDTSFGQSLDDANMGKTSHGAAAESQSNTVGAKLMQTTHHFSLYGAAVGAVLNGPRDFAAEIARLIALHRRSKPISSAAFHKVGRNRVSRTIDAALVFIRRYLPPLHWAATRILALLLYGYARAVRATAEIVTVGRYQWPDVPSGSVLAIWHGSGPSLLVAFTARRPSMPVKLMVSRDPRGDCVALFCRWLGFEVVRGDSQWGGWKALIEIAGEVHNGAAALISPDGNGPPLVARVGAVALATAVGAPLIPVGTDCRPAVFERHKWDDARNPLPYGRIAVACGEPLLFPSFEDAAALEKGRQQLQDALNGAADEARRALSSKVLR